MKRRASPGRRTPFFSVQAMIGNDVYNHEADELGAIQDIVMDLHTGQIGFAVLRCQMDDTAGEKLVAVPWSLLKLDHHLRCFVLDLSIDRLKAAPALDLSGGVALCLTTHRHRSAGHLS